MSTERPTRPFDSIRLHEAEIDRDLARVNQTRTYGPNANLFSGLLKHMGAETDMSKVLPDLEIVTNPQFILASLEGEYVIGEIASTHAELQTELDKKRLKVKIPRTEMGIDLVSGIGFSLRTDNLTKYVRLDVLTHTWQELPKYAKALIEAGYVVVDAQYKRVDKDVDYSIFWTERNDI